MSKMHKTIVQCDFDGTITEEDASFIILDAFAKGKWRHLFREYQEGRMTVGQFNAKAFFMVKADRASLLNVVRGKVKVRPGFQELLACCRRKKFRFVIVSNGLDFYIKEILGDIGITDVEVFAAETSFFPDGLKVQHIGPNNMFLNADVKAAYVDSFLNQGYRVVYIGDGSSDIFPATKSHYVFATGSLLEYFKKENLDCTSFSNFIEIENVLESW